MKSKFVPTKSEPYGSEALCRQSLEAHLAIQFAEKFGLIVGKDSREDSAGRSITDCMPVSEVVQRACDLASGLLSELESRGWIEPIPPFDEEAYEAEQERRESEREAKRMRRNAGTPSATEQ